MGLHLAPARPGLNRAIRALFNQSSMNHKGYIFMLEFLLGLFKTLQLTGNLHSSIQLLNLLGFDWTPVFVAPVICFKPPLWFHLQHATAHLSLSARFFPHGCCWPLNVRRPTSPVAALPAAKCLAAILASRRRGAVQVMSQIDRAETGRRGRARYEDQIGNLKNEITGPNHTAQGSARRFRVNGRQ